MVFWGCIFTTPAIARSERPDLNDDFDDAQRKELCELMDEWLTTHLIEMHGDDFARMHTTNDYLRWHRDHFKHIEHFLMMKGKTQYVPFPKWDPAKPVPSYFNGWEANGTTPYNNISSKCIGGFNNGCRPRENFRDAGSGALDFGFNQSGVFDGAAAGSGFTQDNLPLPTFYDPNGTLCTFGAWNNINTYSNHQQNNYHNAGHIAFDKNSPATVVNDFSIMGTGFGQNATGGFEALNRAAGAFIFWAWHAHIDDMWWDWDVCKKVNANAYTYSNGLTITSGSTVTWDDPNTPIKIQGDLIIEENATLIIKDGQVVEMLDEYFTDQSCDIIVNMGSSGTAGGTLQIENGAVVRGIVSMGSVTGSQSTYANGVNPINGLPNFEPIYDDGQVYYLCKWSGIKVYGDPAKSTQALEHGKVIVDGSASEVLFQYSKSAIESINGGVIQCTNARFRNCDNAINIHSYTDPNPTQELESFITDCTFEQLDQISRYVEFDNMYMHDLHDYRHLEMVKLLDVEGLHIAGCTFTNSDPNTFSYDNRGVGILSLNSKIYVHNSGNQGIDEETQCPTYDGQVSSFEGLSFGVNAGFYSPISQYIDGNVAIHDATFTDCYYSVQGYQQEKMTVYNCKFNYDENVALFPAATTTDPQRFILLRDNWYNIVHGSAMLLDPMDPSSPKMYQSVMNTNSPIATLVEINGPTYNSRNNKVMQNEFINTNPSPESHGLLLRNDNFNSTITCNRFEGFNGAIYNLGKLRDQVGREQGNDFADPLGSMPEQHIRTDNMPLTAFRYETAQPLDVSGNVNVTPPSGGEEPICNLNCESDIADVKQIEDIGILVVYPNPSNGVYHVQIDESYNLDELSIRVIDNIGRVVYNEVPSSFTQKISIIDASGIYYLVLSNNKQIIGRAKLIAYE